jgi:hypothetical protein
MLINRAIRTFCCGLCLQLSRKKGEFSMNNAFIKTYHLLYDPEMGSWKIEYNGADMPFSLHQTKEEALEAGRDLVRQQAPAQLVVHKMDGSIQNEYTYDSESS